MDLQELYNRGYRRFEFSDGRVRSPCDVKSGEHGHKLRFDVGPLIWYINSGKPNVIGLYPVVVGVEDGGTMSNKRDEIRAAIEIGVGTRPAQGAEDPALIVARVMQELDTLIERWADEETAEDLDKSIGKLEVYEGMRVRMIDPDDSDVPVGHTGTIVHPDTDGIPAVMWDSADYNTCDRPHDYGKYCSHVTVQELEKE